MKKTAKINTPSDQKGWYDHLSESEKADFDRRAAEKALYITPTQEWRIGKRFPRRKEFSVYKNYKYRELTRREYILFIIPVTILWGCGLKVLGNMWHRSVHNFLS